MCNIVGKDELPGCYVFWCIVFRDQFWFLNGFQEGVRTGEITAKEVNSQLARHINNNTQKYNNGCAWKSP